MPRTKSRPCLAGRHELSPNVKTVDGCQACKGEAALAWITAWVTAAEPTLGRERVVKAISAAATSIGQLRRLRAYLDEDPIALSRGDSNAENVVNRLAHELAAHGARFVVLPACADCGRPKPLPNRVEGGRVCNECRSLRTTLPCVNCRNVKPVGHRDENGAVWCDHCWRHSPTKTERCSLCDKPGRVTTRSGAGEPICHRCYRAPARACGQCGELGRIVSTRTGTPVCAACYEYPLRPCGRCGRLRQVGRRPRDGEPELCVGCARPPIAVCSLCSKRRRCHFVAEGTPVCIPCSPRRSQSCAHCGHERPATAHWTEGPVCDSCYRAALRHRGACADCRQERRLVDPPGPAAIRCSSCAGMAPFTGHICGRCGTEDKLYERELCPRCVLSDRTTELLADQGGSVPDDLLPLQRAIVASPSAIQGIAWLRRSGAAGILREIRAAGQVPTHETLDRLGRPKAVTRLRHLLVVSEVLPARPERLRELERWIAELVGAVANDGDRHLLRAYARWRLLERLRRGSRENDISVGAALRARSRLRTSLAFLGWLRSRGTTFATCGQADVDLWLATGPPSRHNVREFVLWASSKGPGPPLDVPAKVSREGPALANDERWAIAKRLLQDDGLDPVDRVTGSFVLLYAQQLTRISRVTVEDVTIRPEGVSVRFGRESIELIPPVASLVARLCRERRSCCVGSPRTNWLFPGQFAGQPISASWLGQRLRRLEIHATPARRAALMQLGAELPAVLLADLLGISPKTAVHWVRAAGGDWAKYAAERARTAR